MLIRREQGRDVAAVRTVLRDAFGTPGGTEPVEVGLLDALRDADHIVPQLTLVAEIDGHIVGSVICSRGHVEPGHQQAVGLGPIGVRPEHQGRGVGRALMHAVLGAAEAREEPLVALLGEPRFYGRFGFTPSTQQGIDSPDPDWGDYFQVRTFGDGVDGLRGTFRYAAPFDDL